VAASGLSRLPRGLWYAAIASAGLHMALVAGRLPGSAAAQDPGPVAALSTRTIIVARASERTAAAGPVPEETQSPGPVPPVESSAREAPLVPARESATPGAPTKTALEPAAATVEPSRPRDAETPLPAPRPPGSLFEPRGLIGDRGPELLDDIDASLPSGAGGRGGSVTVRLTISDQGTIERMQVLRSFPPGLLDEAALSALAKVHFSPGLRGGLPVRSEVVFEIDFAAIGKGNDVSGRTY